MNTVDSPSEGNPSPLIIGHRGASAWAPENTLAAFRWAVAAGADGIEMDVRLARDGVPVVIHDADLRRTGGRADLVAELSSAELGRLDVGSWFSGRYPHRSRSEFASETVPTLAQVIELARQIPGPLFVELKFENEDAKPLVAAVCDVIAKTGLAGKVIIKSFRLDAVAEVRRLQPNTATAALFEPTLTTFFRPDRIVRAALEAAAGHISLHHSLARPKLVRLARDAGLAITVWTVDSPRWRPWASRDRIFALITNDPAAFRERYR
jgi:glycerophosphoryl diester phosphodiesterase